jgi:hypothetical protein
MVKRNLILILKITAARLGFASRRLRKSGAAFLLLGMRAGLTSGQALGNEANKGVKRL